MASSTTTAMLAPLSLVLVVIGMLIMSVTEARGASYSCFDTVYEAQSIGNLLYANLWRDHQATGCDPDGMADVYRKYADEDVVYTNYGVVLSDGVEAWITAAVDSGILPSLCENAFFSLAAYDTVILEAGVSFRFDANVVFIGDGSDADNALIESAGTNTGHQHTINLDKDCVATYSAVNMIDEFDI